MTATRRIRALFLIAVAAALPGAAWPGDSLPALQWRALANAPVAAHRHDDVFFLTQSLGWVVNVSGEVHKTSDGGNTWRLAYKNAAVSFRSVGFADSLHGWAGTVFSEAPLYETRDGGNTWSPVSLPESVTGICGISVVNDSVAYGVGTYYENSSLIKTTNGGTTWTTVDMRPFATTMIDVRFLTPDSGFVTGGWDAGAGVFDGLRAVILFTADGGVTWERRYHSDSLGSWIWKLSFPTRGTVYASMERFTQPRATIVKSVDSGRTWTEHSFPGRSDLQGIGFASPSQGWAGTRDSSYATTDGGRTWSPFDFGEGADVVNRFRMLSDTLGYASGRTVYKYARHPGSSLSPDRARRPSRESPLRPRVQAAVFRDETSIAFTLARGETVTISLHDARGRRVLLAANRAFPPGNHVVRLDARALPAGPYLYRLRAGSESVAGELLKRP